MKICIKRITSFILLLILMLSMSALNGEKTQAAVSNAELAEKAYNYLKNNPQPYTVEKFTDSELVDIYNNGKPVVITYAINEVGETAELLYLYIDEAFEARYISRTVAFPTYSMNCYKVKPSGFPANGAFNARTFITKVDGKNVFVTYSYNDFPEAGSSGYASYERLSYYYPSGNPALEDKDKVVSLILKSTRPPSYVPNASVTQAATNNGKAISVDEFNRLKSKYLITPTSTWGFGVGDYADKAFVNTNHDRLKNYFGSGAKIPDKVIEETTQNKSELVLTDWSEFDTGNGIDYKLTNNADKDDKCNFALAVISKNRQYTKFTDDNGASYTELFNFIGEVHFFADVTLTGKSSQTGLLYTQFYAPAILNNEVYVIRVDFKDRAELDAFKSSLPLRDIQFEDYALQLDGQDRGVSFIESTFGIKLGEHITEYSN